MKILKLSALALAFGLLLNGCAASQSKAKLDLTRVVAPSIDGTESKTVEMGGGGVYNDELVEAAWGWSGNGLTFGLRNKTDKAMRLIWDEASLVINNLPHRVIHNGVVFAQRDQPMAPSSIPPGTVLVDAMNPSDYVMLGSYGWEQAPLFRKNSEAMDVQAFVPLMTGDTRLEYSFQFRWAPVEK